VLLFIFCQIFAYICLQSDVLLCCNGTTELFATNFGKQGNSCQSDGCIYFCISEIESEFSGSLIL